MIELVKRRVLVIGAVVSMLGGVALVARGPQHNELPALDMPSSTFTSSTVTPHGPTRAHVDGTEINAKSMAGSHLFIPSLGVYAPLEQTRFRGDTLDIPEDPGKVGIDKESVPITASLGTTLLAGHVRYRNEPGALAPLARVEPGAHVYVTDAEGRSRHYLVESLNVYVKRKLPDVVFTRKGPHRVAIVTCGGPIITRDEQRHFRDNVVAIARPTD